MTRLLRLLAWSDSVLAPTGFGTVSRHVLAALHATGRYRIDQLAVNYFGEFFDADRYPYQLSPARLLDPADPFGNRQLVRTLARGDYDLLWVLNDVNVVHRVVGDLRRVQADKDAHGARPFKTVFYYPVDCAVWPRVADMVRFADAAVTYTQWARQQTLAALPDLGRPVHVIPHGVDADAYYPLPAAERAAARRRLLGVNDPATFVVLNVNRNVVRKDLARSILAFAELRRSVPNARLHLHAPPREGDVDLLQSCAHLGLRAPQDVSFADPKPLADGGLPPAELNALYNAADCFLTTTLGEGWGLTVTEAMAAGVPVVAPRHTAMAELLGGTPNGGGDRGYLYDCAERVRVDNAGYRPMGTLAAIVAQLRACHAGRGTVDQQALLARAAAFARRHTWAAAGRQWVDLVAAVLGSTAAAAAAG